jgi:hypothetical protein
MSVRRKGTREEKEENERVKAGNRKTDLLVDLEATRRSEHEDLRRLEGVLRRKLLREKGS